MRRSAAPSLLRGGLGASNAQGFLAPRASSLVDAANNEAGREGCNDESDAENVDSATAAAAATTTEATAPAPPPSLPLPQLLLQKQQQQSNPLFAAPGLIKRMEFNAPSALPGGGGGGQGAGTVKASSRDASPSSSEPSQFYKVLYCKRSNKKRINKSFSDAYLEVKQQQHGSGENIVLYSDEGRRIASGKLKGARDMPEGAEGEVGQWEFEVCERVEAAAFASGALFLKPLSVGLCTATETPATEASTAAVDSIARLAFRPRGAWGLGTRRKGGAGGPPATTTTTLPPPLHDPSAPGAIVLNASAAASGGQVAVVVDPFLARKLRPHQVEAVRWMYDRIALPPMLSSSSIAAAAARGSIGSISAAAASAAASANRAGCILSHEPGLGKTLSALTLVHTLLRQSPRGSRGGGIEGGRGGLVRRVAVACPASLCDNWAAEVHKWLGSERLRCVVLRGSGADAASDAAAFKAGTATPLLIASYETLRAASAALAGSIELLICDEGHRLKAAGGSRTQSALLALRSPRMLLMTGTPLQNDLSELFALVDFACPGALGTLRLFQALFEVPIRRSRDARASDLEREVGRQRAAELASRVGAVVLRCSAAVNAAYLPPLTVYDVFLRLTDAQVEAYRAVLRGNGVASVLRNASGGGGGGAGTTTVLPLIGLLRKICISPELVANRQRGDGLGGGNGGGRRAASDDAVDKDADRAARAAASASAAASWSNSCKLVALDALLRAAAARGEKVIVTSTSTAVLDVAGLVAENAGLTTARIDGATDARSRLDVVDAFNRDGGSAKRSAVASSSASTSCVPGSRGGDVMLLSMRAGGAGLNLIGANVLVTLDFDWNPATIAQAEARHWRSGQTKPCSVFRLIAAGSIDEKMLQRVLSKKDLAGALKSVGGGASTAGSSSSKKKSSSSSAFTRDELRELFSLDAKTRCGTREIMLKQAMAGKAKKKTSGGFGGWGRGKRMKRTAEDGLVCGGGGGTGNGREEEETADVDPVEADDEGVGGGASSSWLLPAVACAPGDAEAGAQQLDLASSASADSGGKGTEEEYGSKRVLSSVVSTGAVSWVHEEDGRAAATEGGEEEDRSGEGAGGGGEGDEAATEVEEEEVDLIPPPEEEEMHQGCDASPSDDKSDGDEAPAAARAAADDVSHLEVTE